MSAEVWRGRRVIVTAGGTREAIDPVRYVGNRSSGRMGNAIAEAALHRGAEVTLITTAASPPGVPTVVVESAADMQRAIDSALSPGAVLFMAAAVADYRPTLVATGKLKKHSEPWALMLEPTVDILLALAEDPRRAEVFVVGFAAETDDLVANATGKLQRKRLDLIAVNDVAVAMGTEQNALTVLDAKGIVAAIPLAPKELVAGSLLDLVGGRLA